MIDIIRKIKTKDGIFGILKIDGQDISFVTLENLIDAIPAGSYTVDLYDSPTFGIKVPRINVSGRTYIEMHWANFPDQLKGCVAVGKKKDGDAIDNSKEAWLEFMGQIVAWPTIVTISEDFV